MFLPLKPSSRLTPFKRCSITKATSQMQLMTISGSDMYKATEKWIFAVCSISIFSGKVNDVFEFYWIFEFLILLKLWFDFRDKSVRETWLAVYCFCFFRDDNSLLWVRPGTIGVLARHQGMAHPRHTGIASPWVHSWSIRISMDIWLYSHSWFFPK